MYAQSTQTAADNGKLSSSAAYHMIIAMAFTAVSLIGVANISTSVFADGAISALTVTATCLALYSAWNAFVKINEFLVGIGAIFHSWR